MLLEELRDDDPAVRAVAAYALGRLREGTGDAMIRAATAKAAIADSDWDQ